MIDASHKPSSAVTAFQALGLVWDIVLAIAVPTIAFALGGRWLDNRWHTAPLFLIGGFILSLLVASLLVLRKARQVRERARGGSAGDHSHG